ncbi:hypothetical protein L1987_57192 [Smallanthus sonchifolius]|uniref:Uncharacterized protein n=1 Tax=Smallanthus sonchifolius TaxID=185202 RepID=A0ACB9DCW9_9ASTR|nr:hypothetical protein L1987_57192 [Smallanthus sonchifolius]
MALQNSELSKELLDSQAHIWNRIFSFINSMSLKCAVQLQIPDIIYRHGSPMLLSELVEALAIKPERTHFVYRLMRILVHSGLDSIVDVGGGNGTVAKAIVEAFPDIRCISFDLPHVVNGLVGSENLSYVGGGMFQAIPNADAVLLKSILHDWSDEDCMKILKRCREAIPSKENGGKLIIIDMVVTVREGENDLLETQLFCDMLMMTLVTGRERSEKDWAKLFVDAGFSDYKITPILGLRLKFISS